MPAAVAYDGGVRACQPQTGIFIPKKEEAVTLWAILFAIGFPLLLGSILVAVDMRSNLSDLKPSKEEVDDEGFVPIGWPELEAQRAQGRVRMPGYMAEGYRPSAEGTKVDMFILLPEAGHFLRPAHRIPNQMVEIRTEWPVDFKDRQLVRVSGKLDRTFGKPGAEMAAWAIVQADVRPARQQDILKWFQH